MTRKRKQSDPPSVVRYVVVRMHQPLRLLLQARGAMDRADIRCGDGAHEALWFRGHIVKRFKQPTDDRKPF